MERICSAVDDLNVDQLEPTESSLSQGWPRVVSVRSDKHPLIQCPLYFSTAEIEQQEENEKLLALFGGDGKGGLMNYFISDAVGLNGAGQAMGTTHF